MLEALDRGLYSGKKLVADIAVAKNVLATLALNLASLACIHESSDIELTLLMIAIAKIIQPSLPSLALLRCSSLASSLSL